MPEETNHDDWDDLDELDDQQDDVIKLVPVVPEEPIIFFGKEVNAVLFEMIAGIIVFGLACQAVVIWFVDDKLGFSIALWAGIMIAVLYSLHLWWSIGQYLYMGIQAQSLARRHMLFRFLAVAAAMIGAALIGSVQFLAVVLGIFSIKAGAFMQPLLTKIIRRSKVNG